MENRLWLPGGRGGIRKSGSKSVRLFKSHTRYCVMEQFCVLTVVVVTRIYTCDKMIYKAKHAHTQMNACKTCEL